jgi:hypothetical protein
VTETEKTLAVVCERVNTLEQVVIDEKRRLNANLEKIGRRLDDLNAMVGGYRVEMLETAHRKPTWGTAVAITALVGAVSTLATLLLTR